MATLPKKYIPIEERPTSWFIFHVKFPCKIRHMDIGTIEERRERGYVTSFNKDIDRENQRSLSNVHLTINEMVEYYKEGVKIQGIALEDTKTIYEYIQRHLRFWHSEITSKYMMPNSVPNDDLILLDEFANDVYEYAQYFFTNDLMTTELGQSLLGALGPQASSIIYHRTNKNKDTSNSDTTVPSDGNQIKRNSLGNFFEDNRALFGFKE